MPKDEKIAEMLIEENIWLGHNCTTKIFCIRLSKIPGHMCDLPGQEYS
jgi:hypothetical protein